MPTREILRDLDQGRRLQAGGDGLPEVDDAVDDNARNRRADGGVVQSMTEVLIVLRNEAGFLADDDSLDTLYPEGFSASRFAQIIEQGLLWRDTPQPAEVASPPTTN